MKTFNPLGPVLSIALAIILALLSGGVREAAGAGGDHFGSYAYFDVGSDFMSGEAHGGAHGSNAVITGMESSFHYSFDVESDLAYVSASFYLEGIWGDPNAPSNPWLDMLVLQGIHLHESFSVTEVSSNGEDWEFNDVVGFSSNASGYLYREDGRMDGSFYAGFYGYRNLIPTGMSVHVNEYEDGHPDWLPDWQVSFSSSWIITTGFHRVVPAPGTISLMCGAGLCAIRRRR